MKKKEGLSELRQKNGSEMNDEMLDDDDDDDSLSDMSY